MYTLITIVMTFEIILRFTTHFSVMDKKIHFSVTILHLVLYMMIIIANGITNFWTEVVYSYILK